MEKVPSRLGALTGILAGQTHSQRAEAARRRNLAAEAAAEDDKNIRFTIGGVGQRMTKEDFLKQVQKLDMGARKEVVESSNASQAVKQFAKSQPVRRSTQPIGVPPVVEHHASSSPHRPVAAQGESGQQIDRPRGRPRAQTFASPGKLVSRPSEAAEPRETAAERRRRMAVLSERGQAEQVELGETPAERRRRDAALGVSEAVGGEESDSEDEGTERVSLARRGIRFA